MAITLLQTINDILTALDLPPVNSVNDDSYEVTQIKEIIDQQRRLVLARGYYFNTADQTFLNTAEDKVFVTDDVLKIDSTDYALRGRQLWDLTNNTATITESVTITTITSLDIGDLPYECAYYIMTKARTLAQTKLMPDPTTTQVYLLEEQEAKKLFNEFVLESYNANMISDSTDIWQR